MPSDQHFSHKETFETLFFFEQGETAYCFKAPINQDDKIDKLYVCDYNDFIEVEQLFD